MDRKAVPAELTVVRVEEKRLRSGRDRSKADVTDAVLTGFSITFEINRTHVAKEVLAQVGLTFSRQLDEIRGHGEAISAENRIHPERSQRSPALLKACSCAGNAIATEAHLEALRLSPIQPFTDAGCGVNTIELNTNHFSRISVGGWSGTRPGAAGHCHRQSRKGQRSRQRAVPQPARNPHSALIRWRQHGGF